MRGGREGSAFPWQPGGPEIYMERMAGNSLILFMKYGMMITAFGSIALAE